LSRAVRLTLLCHGATTTRREAAFPDDQPLAPGEAEKAAGLRPLLPDGVTVLVSPARAARQTAEALSLGHVVDPALRDLDHGRWAGRPIAEIERQEPENLRLWVSDPDAAPHGGELRTQLMARMAGWMDERIASGGRYLVITHPAVIRAIVLHVLGAPAASWSRIDVEHLGVTDIRSDGRRWTLRSINARPGSVA